MKWKLDVPYMTEFEVTEFKRLRDKGTISTFRTRMCEGILNIDGDQPGPARECPNEIPKVFDDDTGDPLKRYCSKACYIRTEDPIDEQPQEDEDW